MKNRQVSNSVASSKKLEPENLDAITCSYKSFFVKHANCISHDANFEVMILLFYYWLHVKRVNCYVYYDLFCYTGRFVYFGAIFMQKMKWKLRLRTTTGNLPTACKQRMIPDI
jgi:hypothetical protein